MAPLFTLLTSLLLLLLLSAGASARHNDSFCQLTPNRGDSLPDAPSRFYLRVRSTAVGMVANAAEYFDQTAQRSAFRLMQNQSSYNVIVYHDRKQAAVIDSNSRAIPGACSVSSATEEELKLGISIGDGKMSVPSVFLFFGGGDENVQDMGDSELNGVKTRKYYSCFYLANLDTSVELTWHYKVDGSSYTPMQIVIRHWSNILKIEYSITHEIFRFSTHTPRWTTGSDPFMAPPGVYCPGLSSDGRRPTLPFKFGMRLEDKPSIGLGQRFLKEAYDFNASLSLLEGVPPLVSEDPLKYGQGKLQYIHDFGRRIAFISNLEFGNCTYERLTQAEWDSIGDQGHALRMRKPKELFDLDTPNVQYKGSGTTRGYDTEVFISLKRIRSGNDEYNTTVEWHFRNASVFDVVANRMVTVSAPVRCLVTSDAAWMSTTMEIYDFESSKLRFNQHDITRCFDSDSKKHFQIFFPLKNLNEVKYVGHKPNEFISLVLPLLSGALNIGQLRILDPELTFDGTTVIMELTITDKPSILSDAEDTPLSQVESGIQKLIDNEALFAIFHDDNNIPLFATANKVAVVESRGAVAQGGGYSAGDMVGVGIGLLLAGLVAGLIAAFLYWR